MLTVPAVLFVSAVVRTLPPGWPPFGPAVTEGIRPRIDELLRSVNGSLTRFEPMTAEEWAVVLGVRDELQEAIPGSIDTPSFEARIAFVRASAVALLDHLRERLRPRLVDIREGSLIVTVVGAGASSMVAVVTALTARSVIKKNYAEARKADAEARKFDADQRHVAVQTTKLQAESVTVLLDVLHRARENGDPAVERIVDHQVVANLLETLGLTGTALTEAATAQYESSLPALTFLARYLVTDPAPAEGAPQPSRSRRPTATTAESGGPSGPRQG